MVLRRKAVHARMALWHVWVWCCVRSADRACERAWSPGSCTGLDQAGNAGEIGRAEACVLWTLLVCNSGERNRLCGVFLRARPSLGVVCESPSEAGRGLDRTRASTGLKYTGKLPCNFTSSPNFILGKRCNEQAGREKANSKVLQKEKGGHDGRRAGPFSASDSRCDRDGRGKGIPERPKPTSTELGELYPIHRLHRREIEQIFQ